MNKNIKTFKVSNEGENYYMIFIIRHLQDIYYSTLLSKLLLIHYHILSKSNLGSKFKLTLRLNLLLNAYLSKTSN